MSHADTAHTQVSVNDMVTHVDSQDVAQLSLDRINALIRGPVGTTGAWCLHLCVCVCVCVCTCVCVLCMCVCVCVCVRNYLLTASTLLSAALLAPLVRGVYICLCVYVCVCVCVYVCAAIS